MRPWLAFLLVLAAGLVLFAAVMALLSNESDQLVKRNALTNAKRYTDAVEEFRSLYTSEVVARIDSNSVPVVHDYVGRVGAIPLPATLTMKLGKRIGESDAGGEVELYSPFPFPGRKEGGLKDGFAHDAWEALTRDPEHDFYRFEEIDGRSVLRYARADTMRASCVDCHNTHPQTPRSGWREGDVGGVLEIRHLLDPLKADTLAGLRGTRYLLVAITLLAILILAGIVAKLRGTSDQLRSLSHSLDQRVQERSAQLEEAKQQALALERQLLEGKKQEAIGTLAGGVAHEFNNQLSVILGYSELVLEDLDADSPLREQVQMVCQASHEAAQLTSELLSFGRKQLLLPRVFDLNTILEQVQGRVQPSLNADVRLTLVPAGQPAWVNVDPSRFAQAVLNLANNAQHAMPGGGELTLEVQRVELQERISGKPDGIEPGSYAVLAVRDTGTGIPADALDRLFDPFFSTKEVGSGTGLGLAMVHGTVKQSRGQITVSTALGQGSEFKIYLPSAEEPTGRRATEAPSRPVAERTPITVLVVEDEPLVLKLVTEYLSKRNYAVAHAGTPSAALEKCRAQPFDVVLSDVVMPECSGPALVEEILQQQPKVGVVYMSGYVGSELEARGFGTGSATVLNKPLDFEALLEAIEDAAEAPPS